MASSLSWRSSVSIWGLRRRLTHREPVCAPSSAAPCRRGPDDGKVDPRLGLDLLRKAGDHAVKHVDMFIGIAISVGQEQVGDAANNFRLLLR